MFSTDCFSQKPETETKASNKHSIGAFISHTYINQGRIDGELKRLSAPSLGLNYNYIFNDKWSFGLHNDIIIESFIVESANSEEEFIERELPFSTILVGTYKITESLGVAAGAGVEWEKNANFTVVRLGVEYGLELEKESLEVLFVFNYDVLVNAYNSFNFGIGINKFFR
ncbi:hypothetical protein CA834_04860 [Winogradskyella aurantia]|uniref:Outer membrane protein beta-barrel domain-containing protein n=1 Tax=Winogradskyella aurantia TaxID=1915063 RepID=A0A265UXK1_9FLAO|nr:hypothetical protein CA834_04860 [Winogradskyella aurantia]